MNPYKSGQTIAVLGKFLNRFYSDNKPRQLILGINPGRFGSGITGISFTDPIRLKEVLRIDNEFDQRPELSSQFIYEVINQGGGAENFYNNCLVSAVYPLGFLHNGKNINYYEMQGWKNFMPAYIEHEIMQHLQWPVYRERCIIIGKGENFKFFEALNQKHGWFKQLISLPHPRWIMQYRRRQMHAMIDKYLEALDFEHRD